MLIMLRTLAAPGLALAVAVCVWGFPLSVRVETSSKAPITTGGGVEAAAAT
jgi:hypothetical protein